MACASQQAGPCLSLHAGDGAAHDEAVPPNAAIPLGADALDAHVLEPRFGEPLPRVIDRQFLRLSRVTKLCYLTGLALHGHLI